MAKGQSFWAWVDAGTPWSETTRRYDENLFEWSFSHSEGQFAILLATIRNPRVPLLDLTAGRKIWAWWALQCSDDDEDPDMLFKMLGRLNGIPSGIQNEKIVLEFIGRPTGYNAIKQALGESLKVPPYYSRSFVDPTREEEDIDIVLEGYNKRFHIHREPPPGEFEHEVTVSDEINGEGGTVVLGNHLYDGLDIRIPTGPVSKVTIPAKFNWTLLANGTGFDLGSYITRNWPHLEGVGVFPGIISSYTYGAGSWPTIGTQIGDGWIVNYSRTTPIDDLEVRHHSETTKGISTPGTNFLSQIATANWPEGDTTELTKSVSYDYVSSGIGPNQYLSNPFDAVDKGKIVTQDETKVDYDDSDSFGDALNPNFLGGLGTTSRKISSFSRTYAETRTLVPLIRTGVGLHIGFDTKRPVSEAVKITMHADVQRIFTEPDDEMALLLPELNSNDLSANIGSSEYPETIIHNKGALSYLHTDPGIEDLKYLLILLRVQLLKRARCVEVEVRPLLDAMPLLDLTKNLQVSDGRIPGTTAVGKIVNIAMSLKGSTGKLERSVIIQCCVGKGGVHIFEEGDPIYAVRDYMVDEYQEIDGAEFPLDPALDTGFVKPLLVDAGGINLLNPDITIEELLEEPLVVTFKPIDQLAHLAVAGVQIAFPLGLDPSQKQQAVQEQNQILTNTLSLIATKWRLKLKSVSSALASDYVIDTKNLLVPRQINLDGGA